MKSYKYILKSIDASLQYGQFFSGKWTFLFYSLIIFCVALILSCFIWLILVKCNIETFTEETFISMICCLCIATLILIGLLFAIYKNNKLKKIIHVWLQDAVMLSATTQSLESIRTFGHPVAETKLRVNFYYKGQKFSQESGDKTKRDHWYKRNGFFKVLTKYANKEIKILYSPNYNQVMILKYNV